MTLPVAADLANILGDLGVTASVGEDDDLKSTPAQVTPADEEMLSDDSPVEVLEQPVWVVYPAGALGDLTAGDKLTVTGGDLAGTYTVDKCMRIGDGSIAQVLAR